MSPNLNIAKCKHLKEDKGLNFFSRPLKDFSKLPFV